MASCHTLRSRYELIDWSLNIHSYSPLRFSSPEYADLAFVALNSNLFYWFVTTGSDCRNLNMREVLGLPLRIDTIAGPIRRDLRKLAADLAEDLQAHCEYRKMRFNGVGTLIIQCIFPGRSKPIIDEIDRVLARHQSFGPPS